MTGKTQKPSETLATLKDLKYFLNYFVDGSYGLWIDKAGFPNVVVPRAQYVELRREIERRLLPGSHVKVRKQSLGNEGRLFLMRLKFKVEDFEFPSPWRKLAWLVPRRLAYWCFVRVACRAASLENRPPDALPVALCLLDSGENVDHDEAFEYGLSKTGGKSLYERAEKDRAF